MSKTNKKKNNIVIIFSLVMVVITVIAFATATLTGGDNAKNDEVSVLDQATIEANESAVVKDNDTAKNSGVTIAKKSVTEEASFYPYQAGDTYMEVIALRASDGTIRTALNTCQVCNGSGRGYYVQDGDVLVCQNCGNRFTVDQVEVEKGGCNPVPISDGDKSEDEDTIVVPDTFMKENRSLFYNWKI